MHIITYLGLLVLFGLVVFQLLLIFGVPIGKFAWGGQHDVLPRRLRVASSSSIILYALFALFLASKAGVVNSVISDPVLNIGMWVFTAYFIVGIFMNAVSRSKKERTLMTPIALILSIVFLAVTLAS